MSTISTGTNTSNQMTINRDVSKIFVGRNRYSENQYVNNATYNPIALVAGTVMGRVTATGRLVALQSTAVDGSQVPVGILAHDLSVDAGGIVAATIATEGDVVQDMIVFVKPGDGLDTAVTVGVSRRLKDLIHQMGLNIVGGTDQTGYDNQ